MKVWSSESPVNIEVFRNPFTGVWEVRSQEEVSLDFLLLIGHLDMQPSSVGNNPDFLSSLAEQTRQNELLADLRRIMGTD